MTGLPTCSADDAFSGYRMVAIDLNVIAIEIGSVKPGNVGDGALDYFDLAFLDERDETAKREKECALHQRIWSNLRVTVTSLEGSWEHPIVLTPR